LSVFNDFFLVEPKLGDTRKWYSKKISSTRLES